MCGVCEEYAAENLHTDQPIVMSSSLLGFSVCMDYMTHTNHFMLDTTIQAVQNPQEKEHRGTLWSVQWWWLAQSEVCTHPSASVALKGAAIDVECSFTVDGPSLVPVEFSTWCCRSVCSSIAQGGVREVEVLQEGVC
jgi:hypothetical protein